MIHDLKMRNVSHNGNINNNNNHLFYIALLKTPEVALQSRVQ